MYVHHSSCLFMEMLTVLSDDDDDNDYVLQYSYDDKHEFYQFFAKCTVKVTNIILCVELRIY